MINPRVGFLSPGRAGQPWRDWSLGFGCQRVSRSKDWRLRGPIVYISFTFLTTLLLIVGDGLRITHLFLFFSPGWKKHKIRALEAAERREEMTRGRREDEHGQRGRSDKRTVSRHRKLVQGGFECSSAACKVTQRSLFHIFSQPVVLFILLPEQ